MRKKVLKNALFGEVILPAYYAFKGQSRYNYYKEFVEANKLTPEQLQKVQWENLKQLLDHCYQNIPYYRRLFMENDIYPQDIKTLADYSKIPELNKHTIKNNYQQLLDPRLEDKDITFSATGGSTGVPLKIYKSLADQDKGYALRYRSNAWCGWEPSAKAVWFVADLKRIEDVLNQKTTLKSRIGNWIRRKLILDTRDCSKKNMLKWANQIKEYKPEYVYGYSTLLAEFSKFVVNNDIKFQGIKGVYSTAEPLLEREIISKAFNTKVFDQYGCSEIPCIAHECKAGNMHLNSDQILAEFVDIPGCDDQKKIICTPLYAYGLPLLRYDIGDTAIAKDKKCNCGLNYPVIELKVGRFSDNLIAPDSRILSSSILGWNFAHQTNGIQQYQIIQKEVNHVHILLVSNSVNKHENEDSIRDIFYKAFNDKSVQITFEYTDRIPPEKNGKFRTVKSIPLERSKAGNITLT